MFVDPPHEFRGDFDPGVVRIALARNEVESTQLVLWPGDTGTTVSVEVTGAPAGLTVSLHPVGYIYLGEPRHGGGRVGWYPDILLDNQPLALAPSQPQPWLISVRSDVTAAAGLHQLTLVISSGKRRRTLPLIVEVWDFTLPETSAFKAGNLFAWGTLDAMWPASLGYKPLDDSERERLMFAIADLGFRNRLPPTFFFANGLRSWNHGKTGDTRVGFPTHDDGRFNAGRVSRYLDYLLARGANHFFIALTANIFQPPDAARVQRRQTALLAYLDDYLPLLRARGIADMAYVYGIDEPWGAAVEQAKQTYSLLKPRLPSEVRYLQNTNQNNRKILDILGGYFDAIDINLGWFDATALERKRDAAPDRFREVWWNVNLWPDTHPNLFLEYPLTDARIIGSLSYRYRIQGFEYWELFHRGAMSRYQPLRSDAVRVDWGLNNKSMDGNLIYPGRDYRIYSSLRFEALRDGFEDLEYLYLLARRQPDHPLLAVPWVQGIARFERNTRVLESFRKRLAEAITAAH